MVLSARAKKNTLQVDRPRGVDAVPEMEFVWNAISEDFRESAEYLPL